MKWDKTRFEIRISRDETGEDCAGRGTGRDEFLVISRSSGSPYKRSIENQRTVKGFLAENWRWKLFVKCLENSQKRSSNEVVQESLLNGEHQTQRKKFVNWAREKRSTKKLQWESFFPIELDGIYNSENDRMSAVKTEEKKQARKVQKSDGRVRGCCALSSVCKKALAFIIREVLPEQLDLRTRQANNTKKRKSDVAEISWQGYMDDE